MSFFDKSIEQSAVIQIVTLVTFSIFSALYYPLTQWLGISIDSFNWILVLSAVVAFVCSSLFFSCCARKRQR